MQQLYVLRRFSSWSFRLGVSTALLLSSVGLAASLLVGATTDGTTVPRLAWRPRAGLPHAASELGNSPRASTLALPVSLSSMVPAYSLPTSTEHGGAPVNLASGDLPSAATSFEEVPLPTAHPLKATIQRSWNTFKLTFR